MQARLYMRPRFCMSTQVRSIIAYCTTSWEGAKWEGFCVFDFTFLLDAIRSDISHLNTEMFSGRQLKLAFSFSFPLRSTTPLGICLDSSFVSLSNQSFSAVLHGCCYLQIIVSLCLINTQKLLKRHCFLQQSSFFNCL